MNLSTVKPFSFSLLISIFTFCCRQATDFGLIKVRPSVRSSPVLALGILTVHQKWVCPHHPLKSKAALTPIRAVTLKRGLRRPVIWGKVKDQMELMQCKARARTMRR